MSRLSELLEPLTHESVGACAMTRARHTHFIARHLVAPLCAGVAAPPVLALSGAPALWQAAAFGAAMAPLAAVALVSSRGALAQAQTIGLASLAALACVAAIAAGPGFGAAVFLLLLPFEALAHSPRALTRAAFGAVALAALMIGASAAGVLPAAGAAPVADASFGLCGLAYALALACGFRAEARLRDDALAREAAEHASLRALVGDATLRFNCAGVVLSTAGDCGQALGLRARDVAGRGFFERVQVVDRPVFLKALSDAARQKDVVSVRLRLRGPDVDSLRGAFAEPTFRTIDVRLAPFAGQDDVATIVALARDVTEVVEAERVLDAQKAAAIPDTDWKDRLLANVSHELRTPLNAIIGFSDMLGQTRALASSEAQRLEYAGIINASGRHLLSIVNALLDMSKMESGRYEIAAEPLELAPLIESCCDMVRLKAEDAQIEIVRDFRRDIGRFVADERACRQIILNLLSNAIKFTPKGGRVTIGARNEGDHFVLSVADTGVGVSLADLPRLGDPFFQAKSACDLHQEGTGLGLSVVKGLVGLHGGAISFESAPGQGACVTIRLPREGRAAQTPAQDSAAIEIIPRRAAAPVHDLTMVKKIA